MTWDELIDRLLAIQIARNFPVSWVVEQAELAGHPPRMIWRKIAKALGYTQYWADNWKYLIGQETEPDASAIDWEKYPIPEPQPPPEPIPKPVLKRKPVPAHSKL
jgi:hypothetical protein